MFAVFCGLGIHNVINYEQKCKALARYSVALEVSVASSQTVISTTPSTTANVLPHHSQQ